jgi:hypothetical protein
MDRNFIFCTQFHISETQKPTKKFGQLIYFFFIFGIDWKIFPTLGRATPTAFKILSSANYISINLVTPIVRFDVHVTVHRDKFLIIKPTRCSHFSNLFLEWNSTCFGQFLCPSSGVFHCTHRSGICHAGLLTAASRIRMELLCLQWKTPDDGQMNCPKHAEFYSKNKFEKLVHLVGFIIRNPLSRRL